MFKPHLNSPDHFSKLAINATVTTFLKDANPGSTTTARQLSQSVISFDFDSMFDEYKKSQSRTKSFKQSFKHFPRSFRASSKRKGGSKSSQQTTAEKKSYNDKNTTASDKNASASLSNATITPNVTEKEKLKRLLKAKNKTLQHQRDDEIERYKMPPKSISFDEGKEDKNRPLVFTTSIDRNHSNDNSNKNQPAKFFIDFEDSSTKASTAGSRSGSNISLINTTPATIAKSSKMKNIDNVNSTLDNQSNHPNSNSISYNNLINDSFKKKSQKTNIIAKNKLKKQKSLCLSEDGILDVSSQSDASPYITPTTIANQSNGKLTHVSNRSNELVKGMNLEAYDTFV